MIKNSSGDVAMTYYQNTGYHAQLGNGHEYLFVTHRNVCMAWVKEEDVQKMLAVVKTCCGGNTRPIFRLSSQQEVNLWTGSGDFYAR